jgi:hypothetical protein
MNSYDKRLTYARPIWIEWSNTNILSVFLNSELCSNNKNSLMVK